MRLVIHIGFHKTGTSAIQTFCVNNRESLARNGILYPETGASKPKLPSTPTSASGHRMLSDVLVSPTNLKSTERLESLLKEVEGYEGVHTVILSSEIFASPRTNVSPAVTGVLKKYFSEVTIVAYLRRQDMWAETFYKEVLCWNGQREKRDFRKFSNEFLVDWLDYYERLEKWEKVFGKENMIIRSFDDRENRNVIVDLFKTIGFPGIENYVFPGVINPSLPNSLVPLLLEANGLNLTREQKAEITIRIYTELEKSEYKTEKPQIVPDALLREYRKEYRKKNARLCEKYGMGGCDIFSFAKDKYPPDEKRLETSLVKDSIDDIRSTMYRYDSDTTSAAAISQARIDKGRVGVSCLLKESPEQTELFVKYHLALGVSRIRLYMDDPDDPMVNFDYGSDRVEVIKCTPEFWQEQMGGEPLNADEKLYVCHSDGLNYLVKRDDIDWAINLDADELLYVAPGITLAEHLSQLPKSVDQLSIMPLESIFVGKKDSKLFSARFFKVPRRGSINELPPGRGLWAKIYRRLVLRLEPKSRRPRARAALLLIAKVFSNAVCVFLPWIKSDQVLYEKHMPVLSQVMRRGFLAHKEGRTFTRHGIKLDRVTSHRPKYSGRDLELRRRNNTIFVLHYDAVDFAAWRLKWHRRIYGSTVVSAINEKRKLQQEMFRLAFEEGEDRLNELFGQFYTFPKAAIPEFMKAGLVVKLDQPLLNRVKKEMNLQ